MTRRTKRKNGRGVRWCQMKRTADEQPDHSHGAASGVRHIDPATYQPQQSRQATRPRQSKTVALLDEADKLLLRDAYRRQGKRYRDKVRSKIMAGRY